MRIHLKNIPAKFHPDPIWNDGALGFFEDGCPNNNNNKNKNKMSSDMGSVPGPKIKFLEQLLIKIFKKQRYKIDSDTNDHCTHDKIGGSTCS